MNVIVDTVVWSLALRRSCPDAIVIKKLARLIQEQRVLMLGPIRQELLSGYSDRTAFIRLFEKLQAFENEPVSDRDYVQAAEFHNLCRRNGIQGSHTDFLICACAFRLKAFIYTRDKDFEQYNRVLPISLYSETYIKTK